MQTVRTLPYCFGLVLVNFTASFKSISLSQGNFTITAVPLGPPRRSWVNRSHWSAKDQNKAQKTCAYSTVYTVCIITDALLGYPYTNMVLMLSCISNYIQSPPARNYKWYKKSILNSSKVYWDYPTKQYLNYSHVIQTMVITWKDSLGLHHGHLFPSITYISRIDDSVQFEILVTSNLFIDFMHEWLIMVCEGPYPVSQPDNNHYSNMY